MKLTRSAALNFCAAACLRQASRASATQMVTKSGMSEPRTPLPMASRRQAWRLVSIATWMSGPSPGASFGGVARLTVSVCDIGAITAGLAADAADGPDATVADGAGEAPTGTLSDAVAIAMGREFSTAAADGAALAPDEPEVVRSLPRSAGRSEARPSATFALRALSAR